MRIDNLFVPDSAVISAYWGEVTVQGGCPNHYELTVILSNGSKYTVKRHSEKLAREAFNPVLNELEAFGQCEGYRDD